MASKYLKNENGIVKAITTNNLGLEKPLLNENYDIEVHNRNMDKIDSAIQEVKGKVDGLELTAQRVSIADPTNKFEATNVEDALLENKISILNNADLANQALNKANEAFQRGDNVKTQLVDKLISEGLNVSTNDTFENLINNITLGKKWASGEVSGYSSSLISFKTLAGETISCKYITISNLSFIPNTIVYIDVDMPQIGVYTNIANIHSGGKGTIVTNRFHSTVTTYTVTSIAVDENVLVSSSEIRLPFRTGTTSADTVKWIAFE